MNGRTTFPKQTIHRTTHKTNMVSYCVLQTTYKRTTCLVKARTEHATTTLTDCVHRQTRKQQTTCCVSTNQQQHITKRVAYLSNTECKNGKRHNKLTCQNQSTRTTCPKIERRRRRSIDRRHWVSEKDAEPWGNAQHNTT